MSRGIIDIHAAVSKPPQVVSVEQRIVVPRAVAVVNLRVDNDPFFGLLLAGLIPTLNNRGLGSRHKVEGLEVIGFLLVSRQDQEGIYSVLHVACHGAYRFGAILKE